MKRIGLTSLKSTVVSAHDPEYIKGYLEAINAVNELFGEGCLHPKMLGDCVLAKLNMLRPGLKPRRNPRYHEACEAAVKWIESQKKVGV